MFIYTKTKLSARLHGKRGVLSVSIEPDNHERAEGIARAVVDVMRRAVFDKEHVTFLQDVGAFNVSTVPPDIAAAAEAVRDLLDREKCPIAVDEAARATFP